MPDRCLWAPWQYFADEVYYYTWVPGGGLRSGVATAAFRLDRMSSLSLACSQGGVLRAFPGWAGGLGGCVVGPCAHLLKGEGTVAEGFLFGGGVLLAAGSALILWTFVVSRRGTLPRNWVIGIRTWNVLKSEKVWTEIHRRYASIFLMVGLLFAAAAIFSFCGAASFIDQDTSTRLVNSAMLIVIGLLIVGGVMAEVHAWWMNRQLQSSGGGGDVRVR